MQVDKELGEDEIARALEGYSGDDITVVCRDAAMNGMRKKIQGKRIEEIRGLQISSDPVCMADFHEAIARTSPSVEPSDIAKYDKWCAENGSS